MDILATILSVIGALGGLELIKWLFTRKSNKRLVSAQADIAEISAEKEEFHYLRERLEVSERNLLEKEQRFHEQTLLVRDLNRQLLESANENGALKAEISRLKAERAMKLCERRGCIEREPQSGY